MHEQENATIILEDEIDLSRGSSILNTKGEAKIEKTKQISATLCWMQNQPLNLAQKYLLQQGVHLVQTKLTPSEEVATAFNLNDIGTSSLRLSEPILGTPYKDNNQIGRFILIDPQTNNTAAIGFIQ